MRLLPPLAPDCWPQSLTGVGHLVDHRLVSIVGTSVGTLTRRLAAKPGHHGGRLGDHSAGHLGGRLDDLRGHLLGRPACLCFLRRPLGGCCGGRRHRPCACAGGCPRGRLCLGHAAAHLSGSRRRWRGCRPGCAWGRLDVGHGFIEHRRVGHHLSRHLLECPAGPHPQGYGPRRLHPQPLHLVKLRRVAAGLGDEPVGECVDVFLPADLDEDDCPPGRVDTVDNC